MLSDLGPNAMVAEAQVKERRHSVLFEGGEEPSCVRTQCENLLSSMAVDEPTLRECRLGTSLVFYRVTQVAS